jgi:hypothetical protein
MRSPFPVLKEFRSEINWRRLGAEFTVGFVFFTYNFHGFLAYAANHWAPKWLASPMFSLLRFTEKALAFTGAEANAWSPLIAEWLVMGLWWYVAILFITSLMLMKPGRLANGLSGMCVGLAAVVLMSWAGVVLFKTGRFLFLAFHFISSLFNMVFQFINALTGGVLPYLAALALICGVAYVLWKVFQPKVLALYGGLAIAGAGIVWLMLPLLRHLLLLLAPIVAWIVAAFSILVTAILMLILLLGILGALTTIIGMLGRLAIDQFSTAWNAWKGERSIALAGFSVGSAASLLLLVTAGLPEVAGSIDAAWHEHAWFVNTWSPAASHLQALPDVIANPAATVFQHASAPVFDAVILALLLIVAAVGTMRRGEVLDARWDWQYLSADAAKVGGALGFSVVILLIAALLPSQDS